MRKIIIPVFFSVILSNAMTIDDGYKILTENNMDLKIKENQLSIIKIDEKIAKSMSKPTVDFEANVKSNKLTQNKKSPDFNGFDKTDGYEINLTQPIFDGFESKYEEKLQEEKYKSALFDLKNEKNDIAFDYVQSYINLLKEKEILDLRKEILIMSEDIFSKVKKGFDLGEGTKLEYSEAQSNLSESKVNLSSQEITLDQSLEELKYYLQKDFNVSELSKPYPFKFESNNFDRVLEFTLNNNPMVNLSKSEIDVSKIEKKQNDKGSYPTLDFVSSYSLNDSVYKNEDSNEYNNLEFGLQLNYNLYDGNKTKLTKKKYLKNIMDKEYTLSKTKQEIEKELNKSWKTYLLASQKLIYLKEYLEHKNDVVKYSFKEFDLGLQKLNTLLDNYVEYTTVKRDYIESSYEYLTYSYKIAYLLGILNDTLENNNEKFENLMIKVN